MGRSSASGLNGRWIVYCFRRFFSTFSVQALYAVLQHDGIRFPVFSVAIGTTIDLVGNRGRDGRSHGGSRFFW